jgi:hypothetical protein
MWIKLLRESEVVFNGPTYNICQHFHIGGRISYPPSPTDRVETSARPVMRSLKLSLEQVSEFMGNNSDPGG